MPSLPRIGVEAVVDNMAGFNSAIEQVESRIARASSSIQKSAAGTAAFDKSLGGVEGSLKDVTTASGLATAATGLLTGGFITIAASIAVATAAIGLATAAFEGFLALGERGAAMTGVIQSFNILEGGLVKGTNALQKMRDAAQGTITDINLMKRANLGLIGAQGEFAKQLSDALPKALQIARLTAIATGESFDVIYEKLIRGLKRLEPRLIDDTGIVIRRQEAYERYADKINKSTDALSAQEKQIAVLDEFMRLADPVLQAFGDLHETAAIKADRLNTTLTNMGDKLGQIVQPAYESLLDGLQSILDFLSSLLDEAAPYLSALSQMFADLFDGIFGSISDALGQISAGDLVKGFFTGGARIMGALAGGLAAGGKVVMEVVATIAEAIASFLSGFSPPPEGPLHTIDIGGRNVMLAWLEGFMSVSLDPIDQVAAQVADMMGGIAGASREWVAARLKELDAAIAPFQYRLDLIKATFDALKPTVDAAFSAIDRQMETSLKALNKGVEGSGAMVRALDSQREALEGYVDAQQAAIDNAQIQLSLAQAQQAEERTALNIRLAMLGPEEKIAAAAKAPAAKKPKKAGGGGGGGGEDLAGGGGIGGPTSAEDMARQVSDFARQQQANDDIIAAAAEGFAGAGGDIPGLKAASDRLDKAKTSIGDSLKNIKDKIQKAFEDAFKPENAANLNDAIGFFVGEIVKMIGEWFIKKVSGLVGDWIREAFANPSIGPIRIELGDDISSSLEDGETAFNLITPLAANLITLGVDPLTNAMHTVLSTVAASLGEGDPVTQLLLGMDGWLQAGGVNYLLTTGLNAIRDAVADMIQKGPINWLVGAGIGVFSWAFDTIIQAVVDYINGPLKPIITSIGQSIAKFISDPLGAIGSAITGSVASGLRKIVQAIRSTGILNIIPQLAAAAAAFDAALGILGGAKGGVFSGGLLKVGEKGPELIGSADKLAVFPANVTRMLESLNSIMAQPRYVPAQAASYQYNNQRSMGDMNFYGVQGTDDAIHRMSLLRATRKM